MKKITKSMITKVKRHLKKEWHDKEWHEFNRLPETEAIIYAINMREDEDDIINCAVRYLNLKKEV